MTTLTAINNNNSSLTHTTFETSQYQGHTIFKVDASYLAKKDVKAGGVGPEMFDQIFKAMTVGFTALVTAFSTAAVSIAVAITTRSVVATAIAGGITAAVSLAVCYGLGLIGK